MKGAVQMAARKKKSFEEGIAELEGLIASLSEGGLSLDEAIRTYEKGVLLHSQLDEMLSSQEKKIEMIDPDTGEIRTFEGE